MLLSDKEIRDLCKTNAKFYEIRPAPDVALSPDGPVSLPPRIQKVATLIEPLLDPFSEPVSDGVISYGLTSAGYDLRLGPKVLIFKNTGNWTVHPKRFKDPEYRARIFDEYEVDEKYGRTMVSMGYEPNTVIIPPNSYMLGHSLEYIRMPRQLKGRCVGKSTLARSGILINTTPLEPEWEGHLTIEISNVSPQQACVFVNEGIAQLEFEIISGYVEETYKTKQGKYQGSLGVTPAMVK